MKIDFAIHSVDDNPLYSDFWPSVSKVWKSRFNIEPILVAVMNKETFIQKNYSEEFGKVINIEPVDGIPTHIQAQFIRFWYSINFPEQVSIISDIDMFPISKKYFIDNIKNIDSDKYVHLYSNFLPYLPVCYHVAKGKTFKEILHFKDSYEDFIKEVIEYDKNGTETHMGLAMWGLDEKYTSDKINNYDKKERLMFLQREQDRIDRQNWQYDETKIDFDFYADAHSIRPYSSYKEEIEKFVSLVLKNEQ